MNMENSNYYCLIMAGGAGRRFWPFSRKGKPKQFLDFFGTGDTLLQKTYSRYAKIVPKSNIFVTTNVDYVDLVKELLPEIADEQIIIETERRNTGPAIAYASYHIRRINPNATVVVAPSDQVIMKLDVFKEAIEKGLDFAAQSNKLLIMGIRPTYPETGYGYIQIDEGGEGRFHKVKTFIEKPAKEFAEVFCQGNEFFWNSGIFIWNVSAILSAFVDKVPDICQRVECEQPDFSACPNSSIEYSIIEKSEDIYVEGCDFGWFDIGTWTSLYEISEKDENQNVTAGSNVSMYNCKNNIVIMPKNKLVVMQDLDGYLVTEKGNAILICKKDDHDAQRNFFNDMEMKYGDKYM